MINHFTFNGTSTADLGLIVSGVSIFGAGSRKVEKAGIPGRNGDLQIELGGFNNYTVRYTVSITNDFTTTAQQIREWLLESKGYCDLTDTYHPDEIRKACFNSDIEFTTSMLYKYGQASIQFDCLPERYLTTNTPITTTATADTTTDTAMSLNTVPTPLNISLNGNTTQEGSSGKNLLDFTYWAENVLLMRANKTVSNGNFTITSTGDDAYTRYDNNALFPTVTANTNYTFSWNVVSNTGVGEIYIFGADSSVITHIPAINNHYVTFNSGSNTVIKFRLGVTSTGTSITFNNLQLEKGSTATAYEPHISPTNSQVIHNVSGDNEVKVLGKNLFEPTLISNGTNITHSSATTDVQVGVDGTFTWKSNGTDMYIGQVGGAGNNYQNTFGILIPVLPNTNYVLSDTSGYGANYITWYDANKKSLGYVGAFMPVSAKKSPANARYASIRFGYNQGVSGQTYSTRIQFEQANAKTDFEPYTRQSYPLYLPIDNLLHIPNGQTTRGGVTFKETDNGIEITGSTQSSTFVVLYDGTLPSGDYTISGMDSGSSANTYQIVIYKNGSTIQYYRTATTYTFSVVSTDAILIRFFVYNGQGDFGGKILPLQLNKGANANQYNPYGTTPIELNGIGTYSDYIYKNGGKWYLHKAIGKVDMGTLSWNRYQFSEVYAFYCSVANKYSYGSVAGLCEVYPVVQTPTSAGYLQNKTMDTQSYETYIYVRDDSYTDARTFKTSLNGVLLYYPLQTPTNTEITDTTLINQLNNIEKAYSYNGTTNILQVSNDNGFMLGVVSLHGSTFTSNYKGEPIITVNSTGLIYLNGEVMEVLSAPVTINCQTMQCYNGVVNMNNEVRVNDFPEIKIGSNEVGSSMALTITPNNWRH